MTTARTATFVDVPTSDEVTELGVDAQYGVFELDPPLRDGTTHVEVVAVYNRWAFMRDLLPQPVTAIARPVTDAPELPAPLVTVEGINMDQDGATACFESVAATLGYALVRPSRS